MAVSNEGGAAKLYCAACHRKIHDIHKVTEPLVGGAGGGASTSKGKD